MGLNLAKMGLFVGKIALFGPKYGLFGPIFSNFCTNKEISSLAGKFLSMQRKCFSRALQALF